MRWILLIFLVSASVSAGEIYRWTDEQGKVQFGDRPPTHIEKKPVKLRINTYTHSEIIVPPASNRPKTRRNKKVVMYSAEWCGICKEAGAYFREHGIRFTEYDIDKSEKGKQGFKALKGRGVPIILVGKARMNGFTVAHFNQLYER